MSAVAKSTCVFIPFWFEASILRVRCRKPDHHALLRGTLPLELTCLTADEAPITVEVEIAYPDLIPAVAGFTLSWRADAISYLRPVHHVRSADRVAHDFNFYADGNLTTIEDFKSILTWDEQIQFDPKEFPERWLVRGMAKFAEIKQFGVRQTPLPPAHMPDPDWPGIKEWKSSKEAEGRAEAAGAASNYLFVDGILHRRVPRPLWSWAYHIPKLVHGEGFKRWTGDRGAEIFWWPLSRTDQFGQFLSRTGVSKGWRIKSSVDFKQVPDDAAEMAQIGRGMLEALRPFVRAAVPTMSDDSLDLYKTFRKASEGAEREEIEACRLALATLEQMLSDPCWGYTSRKQSVRDILQAHLQHWHSLLYAAGLSILDPVDEEALGAISA